MSNNKQSSIEWFYLNLTDDLIGDLPPEKILKIHELKEQAKAMRKEELEIAFKGGMSLVEGHLHKPIDKFEEFYNEKFNNES